MRHTVNCLLHRPQHASLFSVTTKQRATVGGSVERHRVQRQGTHERQLPHLKAQRRRRPVPAWHIPSNAVPEFRESPAGDTENSMKKVKTLRWPSHKRTIFDIELRH
jgi:hypothetical protein